MDASSAGTSGPHGRSTSTAGGTWVVRAAFAAAFAAAVALGFATRIGASPLALASPAGAVGYLWLARSAGRRALVVDALVLAAVRSLVSAAGLTMSVRDAVVLGLGAALQSLVCLAVVRCLSPRGGHRLSTPRDLFVLTAAAVAGSAADALVVVPFVPLPPGASVVVAGLFRTLRDGVGMLVVTAVVLRVLAWREAAGARGPRRRGWAGVRAAVSWWSVLAVDAVAFWTQTDPMLVFTLVLLSVWTGLSRRATAAALHAGAVAVVVLGATWLGRGPFGGGDLEAREAFAQLFVGVVGFLALLLSLHRAERDALLGELTGAVASARDQSALLEAVFSSTGEAVVVLDLAGRPVLRNTAAQRVLGGSVRPDATSLHGADGDYLGWTSHRLDGSPLPPAEAPEVLAAACGSVPAFDKLMRHAATGRELIVSGSAHRLPPVPGVEWSEGVVLVYRDVTVERRQALEVAATRDRLAGILDAATEQAIIGTDPAGVVTFFNQGAERLTGHAAHAVVGRSGALFMDVEEIARRRVELGVPEGMPPSLHLARTQRHDTRQWTVVRADGEHRQVQLVVTAVRDEAGAITGFMTIGTDITERLETERRLADSEGLFRVGFALAPVGMAMLSLSDGEVGRVLEVNQQFAAFFGRSQDDLAGTVTAELFRPQDADDHRAAMEAIAAAARAGTDGIVRSERQFVVPDGRELWGSLSCAVVRPSGDAEPYLLAMLEDVTAHKEAEQALQHLALHDALTGLPNARLFADRLDQALAGLSRTGHPVGVLYLDLDGFKAVNDTLGHAAGDELLRHVADRLRRCVRVGDTVARLGGDEFAVVCPDVGSPADLEVVGRRILAAVGEPVLLSAGSGVVGVSIGATTATGGQDVDQLVQEADAAMYAAKRQGKGRLVQHARAAAATPAPLAVPASPPRA